MKNGFALGFSCERLQQQTNVVWIKVQTAFGDQSEGSRKMLFFNHEPSLLLN